MPKSAPAASSSPSSALSASSSSAQAGHANDGQVSYLFYAIIHQYAYDAAKAACRGEIVLARNDIEDAERILDAMIAVKSRPLTVELSKLYNSRCDRAIDALEISRSAVKFAGILIYRDVSSVGLIGVFEIAFFSRFSCFSRDMLCEDTTPISSLLQGNPRRNSLLAHFPDKTLPCSWFSVPDDFFSASVMKKLRAIDKDLAKCKVGKFTPRPLIGAGLIPRLASAMEYFEHMADAVKDTSEASKTAFCLAVKQTFESRLKSPYPKGRL